ncbi:SH3 domain-containing protein [Actinocatenispora comari]|uniref:SH3b domain-containing protein n=1 Tax=Actinocatenispora comari TaxID=2807577 RepID=A0A8J4A5S6_9ACTN|nr:SH3 domain-containing protein [Actinocatenispora comari]GIL24778.1 hypothetical protein NUM_00330 [Actinocatenispora comari]GIL30571.1 hypothetical protein NUM_58250 [Actinocatenispora comari]
MSRSSHPRSMRRLVSRAGLIGAAALAAVLVAGQASAATVHTSSGKSLNVRSGPHTSSKIVGSVRDGATVSISCQAHGDKVTGKYGTSDLWDKVSGGYVSDTYVYTGSDGRVAKLCGSSTPTTKCSTSGTGDPRSCAKAVTWAKNHRTTTYHSGYYRMCDHLVGLAYGFSHSGSTTAYVHWTQVPKKYKHAGSTTVPAGGLAFFGGGSGHVMISIGGGKFVSNDIHGNGTYTTTTIKEIKQKWGKPYLGWTQPWFKANH